MNSLKVLKAELINLIFFLRFMYRNWFCINKCHLYQLRCTYDKRYRLNTV